MALPSALQQRLLKRGIIKKPTKPADNVEEVFAESYDEPNESNKLKGGKADFDFDKVPDCPNRTNSFHECTDYCAKKYGFKKFQPHPVFERRRVRMLKIYPLLPNWVEVPDINTNRYYYWNTETNQVCWLSPSCPKAKFEYPKKVDKSSKLTEKGGSSGQKTLKENMDEFVEELDQFASTTRSSKSDKSASHKRARVSDKLDPMDPSSYSDVPRGKWSAGLDSSTKNAD